MSAPSRPLAVAVTGLNATDNPAPGVGVIRSLRAEPSFAGRLLGFGYDALDPGLYARDIGLDAGFLIPYPGQGVEALRDRLRAIRARAPFDVLVPTLDSELAGFIALAPELQSWGVRTFLPTREQLDLRAKSRLPELGRRVGVEVPEQRVVGDPLELHRLGEALPFPLVVKGSLYGAAVVRGPDEAVAAFHATVARWGLPVVVQRFHAGEEYDVVGLGDGRGGLVGAVPMKKLLLTEQGKGWAGVAVRDARLLDAAARFAAATAWRGPFELEILRTPEGRYLLLEVNPRFPAWSHMATGAGQNLAWAVVRLALGEQVAPLPEFRAGTLFVRIALDQIASIDDLQSLSTAGEISLGQGAR